MTKMLFIQSEDYWGYDASSFDDTINFYKFSWTVPLAQYMEMSEEDQKRLYPCALFYVAGVTDNHNFLTLKIIQDSTEAKVSGMEGTKRRTRRYQIGSNAQYSVGSYALQAAPASATNIMEIKEAVEAGSTSEGSFLVSGFLDDAASVAKQVNYEPAEKSAESVGFAAPATEPSGSAYEPADPTVANPSTEGPSESELITMSAEIEYAELGDESYPIVPNTTGQDSSFSGHGVPQWYGSAEQGYNDRDDESIGMRHRGPHKQSLKSRRDESKGMTGSMNHHHPYSDVGTMMAETEMGLPVVPNSFGEESTVVSSGHGVPQWIGSAEFEAQPRTRMTTAGGTRKYVRRNDKGQFTTYQVNVDGKRGAAAIDRRMKAKNYAKPGYRNEGDANPVRQSDRKNAEARTRMTLQDGTRRYVRRNKQGQFTNYQVNVDGKKGAIANDRRQKAKNYAKPGFRNEGDAKATRQSDRR